MATVTKPIALDESINTTEVTPRNVADVLAQELSNIASAIGGGGGSGGHTIENSSGIALPQRTNLQFGSGLGVTDDAVNDATVVELTGESVHANMFFKLWENPDPTSNFAAQSIALSSNDYDFLMWVYTYATNNARTVSVISDDRGTLLSVRSALSSTPDHTRIVSTASPADKIHFSFTDCYYNTSQTDNSCIIPVFVYGFKKSLDITAIVSNVSTDATRCIMSDGVTNVEDAVEEKARKTDIATVESGSTASRAYSVGELVYVNGNLYKVITAISLGSAFTVGTNIQSTTVSEALEDSKRVTLYNTAFTYDNTVVLNDSAENYEFLEIRIADSSDSSSSRGGIVISKGLYNITGFYPVRQSDYIRVSANGTSFRFVSGSSSIYIHSIVGIKN